MSENSATTVKTSSDGPLTPAMSVGAILGGDDVSKQC
jgi:hypothetical protein